VGGVAHGRQPSRRGRRGAAHRRGRGALGDLATAAAAAHNQLAPWVETIELRAGDLPLASIDRTALPSGPLVDPSRLVTAADPGAGAMAEGIGGFDRGMALACASAPVP